MHCKKYVNCICDPTGARTLFAGVKDQFLTHRRWGHMCLPVPGFCYSIPMIQPQCVSLAPNALSIKYRISILIFSDPRAYGGSQSLNFGDSDGVRTRLHKSENLAARQLAFRAIWIVYIVSTILGMITLS